MDSFDNGRETLNPLMEQPDAMRDGLSAYNCPMEKGHFAHPAEAIQKNAFKNEMKLRNHMLRNAYGSHFVEGLEIERAAMASVRRGAGLPSSMTALETSLGTMTRMSTEDFMDLPQYRERMVNTHLEMEKRYDEMGW